MTQDSLKRLLVTVVAALLLAAQPLLAKVGMNVDPTHAVAFAVIIVGFLFQSGLKSTLTTISTNKTMGAVFADFQKAKAFFDQIKAAQAKAAGQGVAVAAPPPGAPGGPSQS